jgi:dephospho-CoA kinase
MISIAITGGIGSGKSYISNILQEYGIPIYNTDDEAKRLMVSDEGIRHDLVTLLGEEVYVGGTLNKALLASYLFADAQNASRINGIVHPRVKKDFCRWLEQHMDKEIVGMECAILFEAGFDDAVDAVVMVYAPESLRIERAMKRDNATEAQIRARIAAQMNDDEKCKRADYIIYTDGSISLDSQLSALIAQLKLENK